MCRKCFSLGSQTRVTSTKTCSRHVQVLQLNLKTLYPECCQIFGARFYYCTLYSSTCPTKCGFLCGERGGHSFLLAILSPKPVSKLLVELIAVSCLKEGIDYFVVGHVIVSWWQNVCKTSV